MEIRIFVIPNMFCKFKTQGGVPELGAMVMTANYSTLDTVIKHQIEVTPVLRTAKKPLNEIIFKKSRPSLCDQITYAARFFWQHLQFAKHVWNYKNSYLHLEEKLPLGLDAPFDQFCENEKLDTIARLQKIWVPGMGYGDLEHNVTYRVLNYMGYSTMLHLIFGSFISHCLLTVKEGYQTIIEKMAEGIPVELSTRIVEIIRNNQGVSLHYLNKYNELKTLKADYLVLSMSPYYWHTLNMPLTPIEKQCVSALKRTPYSTAIVDIEGYCGKQLFIPEALNAKGFGHVGFISTKGENRCVVYVNRDPSNDQFSLAEGSMGRKTMIEDLRKLGYEKVNILKTEDWPDYNATIPWELGMSLEKQQGKNYTLYVGTFRPTSFESVAAAEESSRTTIRHFLNLRAHPFHTTKEYLNRAYHFFFKLPFKPTPQEIDTKNKKHTLTGAHHHVT